MIHEFLREFVPERMRATIIAAANKRNMPIDRYILILLAGGISLGSLEPEHLESVSRKIADILNADGILNEDCEWVE